MMVSEDGVRVRVARLRERERGASDTLKLKPLKEKGVPVLIKSGGGSTSGERSLFS